MTPELRVTQRDAVVNLCLDPDPLCYFLAFVIEGNFTGLDYERRSGGFAKIKVERGEKGKEISVSRWTREKYFVVGAISTE